MSDFIGAELVGGSEARHRCGSWHSPTRISSAC